MSMNFVTFNQDYSHLAVGIKLSHPRDYSCPNSNGNRNIARLPDIYYGSFCKMFRDEGGGYRHVGDAVLDFAGGPDTFAPEITDQEYQSTPESAPQTEPAPQTVIATSQELEARAG